MMAFKNKSLIWKIKNMCKKCPQNLKLAISTLPWMNEWMNENVVLLSNNFYEWERKCGIEKGVHVNVSPYMRFC